VGVLTNVVKLCFGIADHLASYCPWFQTYSRTVAAQQFSWRLRLKGTSSRSVDLRGRGNSVRVASLGEGAEGRDRPLCSI